MSMFDALSAFLAPLTSKHASVIEGGDPRTPVLITIAGGDVHYTHHTTLGVIQAMDQALCRAYDRNDPAKKAKAP